MYKRYVKEGCKLMNKSRVKLIDFYQSNHKTTHHTSGINQVSIYKSVYKFVVNPKSKVNLLLKVPLSKLKI